MQRIFVWMAVMAGSSLMMLAAKGAGVGSVPASAPWPATDQQLWPLGVFEKKNMEKSRPKPAFDMTGTWTLDVRAEDGGVNFLPLPHFTPKAQATFDAGLRANAEGKAYMDDPGLCWPAGMPRWLTRVWPIQFMQYPTVIVGIQGLYNAPRWIYLDGRGHVNPDLVEQTYSGDSIGRWEGDTLVVDTNNFQTKHHWVIQGVPISEQFHILERIHMAKDHKSFTDELTMTDPENWDGEWRSTKVFVPVVGQDVTEVHCLPDANEHIIATHPEHNDR